MKKFLSLVLALVMTMSLVTISAGAAEYKDLTDKSEIKYEEAVAVLNKIGIITGYEDGSFKPSNNLTRGAAAKIIVSLMIGPEAANNLSVTTAPYKDVPVTNTFAAVISYCKTAKFISGYGDNTFRPSDPLTGYAFSKMLLGALGYKSEYEGFTGAGWNMKVASLSNKAGLLNGLGSAFAGNSAVTREVACQLALNTLKATTVEYKGTTGSVVIGDTTVNLGNNQYSYVTSNNKDINANIKGKGVGDSNNDYITLEFGEEHFADLKLVPNTVSDNFGRPSNQWSFKNVRIGTYAQDADFTFTNTASGDTDADKVKDMGIKDYTVASGVKAVVNGSTTSNATYTDAGKAINSVTDIPSLLGKGTLVQLYISDTTANQITDVVVIRSQLMQVNSVNSSAVTLKKVESTGLTVASVKDGDANFKALSGMKADDYVLVVPVQDTLNNYVVDSIATPTTASGKLTKISVNSKNAVTGVTVGGTDYKMSYNWTSEDGELKYNTSLSNNKDATAYMDSYGYAIYVSNVVASNSVIVIDDVYSSLIDGKIINMIKGWDINGNELTLNVGTNPAAGLVGQTREYAVSTSNNAEYALVNNGMVKDTGVTATYVKTGDVKLNVTGNNSPATGTDFAKGANGADLYFDSGVKFVFLSKDINGDVTGVTVKSGVSEVGASGTPGTKYPLTYVLNKEGTKITAVIVPNDNDAAVTANLIYISKVEGTQYVDGQARSVFTAYIDGVKTEGLVASKNNAAVGFYTYSKNDTTSMYTLSSYTQPASKATSVLKDVVVTSSAVIDKTYIAVNETVNSTIVARTLNAKNATVIDLTSSGKNYGSLKDLVENTTQFTVSLVYNDSNNTGAGTVSYLYVTAATDGSNVPSQNTDLVYTGTNIVNDLLAGTSMVNYYKEAAAVPTILDQRNLVNKELVKAGATNISWTGDGKVTFTTSGSTYSSAVAVDYTRTYKLTVDGTVSYLAVGGTQAPAGTGTGYIVSVAGATATYADYAAYTMTAADAVVETGYVSVAVPSIVTNVTYSTVPTYAKASSTINVTVTVAAAQASGTVSLTATGATSVTNPANVAFVTGTDASFTFTINVGAAKVTAITAAVA